MSSSTVKVCDKERLLNKIGITDIDDWYCDGYTGPECWVVYTEIGNTRSLKAKTNTIEEATAFLENLVAEWVKNGKELRTINF
jgi:hypothetical protein